jgi:malate dehydrogenase (oxaloacetate-decarboxylating)(NADP+)
MNIPVFHDD